MYMLMVCVVYLCFILCCDVESLSELVFLLFLLLFLLFVDKQRTSCIPLHALDGPFLWYVVLMDGVFEFEYKNMHGRLA